MQSRSWRPVTGRTDHPTIDLIAAVVVDGAPEEPSRPGVNAVRESRSHSQIAAISVLRPAMAVKRWLGARSCSGAGVFGGISPVTLGSGGSEQRIVVAGRQGASSATGVHDAGRLDEECV